MLSDKRHTVDCQIAKCGACRSLNLCVMATEEEEDGIQGIATNRAHLLLGDFGERKGRAALQVNVVGKRECGQRGQGRSFEEVGGVTVFELGCEEPGRCAAAVNTHFLGTAADLRQPPAHSPATKAHRIATCAPGLHDTTAKLERPKKGQSDVQQKSQQLATLPMGIDVRAAGRKRKG